MRYSLVSLLGLVLFAAVACGALISVVRSPGSAAAAWWASAIATATLTAWAVCLLSAIFLSGRQRATALGATVAAGLYWLLALSPWLGPQIGPRLVTTRSIQLAEQRMMAGNSGRAGGTGVLTVTLAPPAGFVPGVSLFADVAHHVLIWALAFLGAVAARLIYNRSHAAASPAAAPHRPETS